MIRLAKIGEGNFNIFASFLLKGDLAGEDMAKRWNLFADFLSYGACAGEDIRKASEIFAANNKNLT